MKIVIEVVSYDVDYLTMVERLKGGVVESNNEIGKELKDKFKIIGMI